MDVLLDVQEIRMQSLDTVVVIHVTRATIERAEDQVIPELRRALRTVTAAAGMSKKLPLHDRQQAWDLVGDISSLIAHLDTLTEIIVVKKEMADTSEVATLSMIQTHVTTLVKECRNLEDSAVHILKGVR